MKKENLVILKTALNTIKGNTIFKTNIFYRCIPDTKGYIIFGEWFSKTEYKSLFELAHTRVVRDFKELGIVTNDNKPCSKTLFTFVADIHKYGIGKTALKVWYIRNTKERIYAFYPMQGTKAENQKECYQWFLDIVNGDVESLDNKDVMFGNSGIPLGYNGLRIS